MSAFLCHQADGVFCPCIQASQDKGAAVHRDLHFVLLSRGADVSEAISVELGHWSSPAKGQGGFSGVTDFQVLRVIELYKFKQQSSSVSELPWDNFSGIYRQSSAFTEFLQTAQSLIHLLELLRLRCLTQLEDDHRTMELVGLGRVIKITLVSASLPRASC